MSLPDLSFLHQAQASRDPGQEVPGPSSPPPQPERRSPQRAEEPLAELISELRSYQAELEAQNKVLQYSQTAAEGVAEREFTAGEFAPGGGWEVFIARKAEEKAMAA